MKEIYKRIITGACFGIIVILSILIDWKLMALVFGVFLILSALELAKIIKVISPLFPLKLFLFLVLLFYLALIFATTQSYKPSNLTLLFLVFPILATIQLFKNSFLNLSRIFFLIFGLIYLVVPFGLLLILRIENESNQSTWIYPLFIISTIWVYDTFAYFTGILFGKTKLFERISPKKTWEGLIGGLLMSLVFYYFAQKYIIDISFIVGLFATVLIVFSSTLGDLFESFLKRKTNFKDSSNILPGHGGVLDRFDSVFFAVPVFYVYYHFFI